MKTTDNNKENVKKISFDKSNSLALKGIAILMMLMHHSFLSKSIITYSQNIIKRFFIIL